MKGETIESPWSYAGVGGEVLDRNLERCCAHKAISSDGWGDFHGGGLHADNWNGTVMKQLTNWPQPGK